MRTAPDVRRGAGLPGFVCCPLLLLLLVLAPVAQPGAAQTAADSALLRMAYATRIDRLEALHGSRQEAALHLVALAREGLGHPAVSGLPRRELLTTAQELVDRVASLDEEISLTGVAVRELRRALIVMLEAEIRADSEAARTADARDRPVFERRIRDLEVEVARLQAAAGDGEARPDPLTAATAAAGLSALAAMAEEEYAWLVRRHGLEEDLRLFLGSLRLFDETGMPPALTSQTEGGAGPGCPPIACPVAGLSPADVPLAHAQPRDGTGRATTDGTVPTPASLVRLRAQLASLGGGTPPDLTGTPGIIRREITVGTTAVGFRRAGERMAVGGAKVGAYWLHSVALPNGLVLTLEPALGGRVLQAQPVASAEVAAEVRETLEGAFGGARSRWQVVAWQKGRLLSDPLPLPGYLEPGRGEAGLTARAAVPLTGGWDVEASGGGDLVRYGPEEWQVLDRQGGNASLGLAWRGAARSGRISLAGSHHAFAHQALAWEPRRQDVRVGVEADGSFEGSVLVRVSGGLGWNDSRLSAYDYRSARAAVLLSAPWRGGSVQGYGAAAHQVYTNPGPEEARVAPSDRDTGSTVVLQYAHPLTETRTLALRAEWSRSESGFRRDFHHRFGASVQVTFRGMAPSQAASF